jgi:hypothetical protein
MVLISGEAGIGKSRLTAALLERLGSEPTHGCAISAPRSTPIARFIRLSARWNARPEWRTATRLKPSSTSSTSCSRKLRPRSRTQHSFPRCCRSPTMVVIRRFELDPQHRRQRTLQSLISQLQSLTHQSPVLMIFEDAHWTDPTSLQLFGRIVDRIATLPVLLIVTFRPEFAPPWIGQPHVSSLTMGAVAPWLPPGCARRRGLCAQRSARDRPRPHVGVRAVPHGLDTYLLSKLRSSNGAMR